MSKPYDVTTKELLEAGPEAWLKLAGIEVTAPVALVDSNLSSLVMEADKVVAVMGDPQWLIHVEFQTGSELRFELRLLRYNVVLEYKHECPVLSLVVLLRKEADSPRLTGEFQRQLPDGSTYDSFRYRVVRVWELSPDTLLEGELATLPLAPIAAASVEELPDIIHRIRRRLEANASLPEARHAWAATYLLLGLKYSPELIDTLPLGVELMKESSTYQAIVKTSEARGEAIGEAIGRMEEARKAVLRIGGQRFGGVPAEVPERLKAITDLEQLEQLYDRLLEAPTWDALLN